MISKFASNKVKVMVFDVDDTITRGTLSIKLEIWKDLFADKLEKLQEARELYEFTGMGDRYNMIAHIIDEPQENCRENKVVNEWADKFEVLTLERIREGGIHEADLEALVQLRTNFSGPVYLLSATPQAVVAGNIEHFEEIYPQIRGMFAGIIGTPMSGGKAGELTQIAADQDVSADQILMVGDGGSDYNGANGAGTQFVGIVPTSKVDKWTGENFPKVSSVAELPELVL